MSIIRRFYVYVICGISLGVLFAGLANVVAIALLHLWDATGGDRLFTQSATDVRRELSLFLALTGIALPIWLIHWSLAERWIRRDETAEERSSGVRALYFALVLSFSLGSLATSLGGLVDSALTRLFGLDATMTGADAASAGSFALVGLLIWVWHAWFRDRDTRVTQMSGNAAWFVRLYRYAATFVGAVVLLIGLAGAMALIVETIVESGETTIDATWLGERLPSLLSMILLGGAIWTVHWGYGLRLIGETGWRGESERTSDLRSFYLFLATTASLIATLVFLSLSLTDVLRAMFGVDTDPSGYPLWADVTQPILIAIPFAASWWFHRRRLRLESATFVAPAEQRDVVRSYRYLFAFVGLVFAAIGAGYLVGIGIEFAFDWTRILDTDPEWLPDQASQFLAILLLGGSLWAFHWLAKRREATATPAEERGAYSRRAYLYLVLTFSTLALLVSLAIILYQGLQVVLDVRTTEGLVSDIGRLLGVAIVATGLLVYHLMTLLADSRYGAAPVPYPPAHIEPASTTLTLTAPDVATLERAITDLRRSLPEGVTIQEESESPVAMPVEREGDDVLTAPAEASDGEPEGPEPGSRIFT